MDNNTYQLLVNINNSKFTISIVIIILITKFTNQISNSIVTNIISLEKNIIHFCKKPLQFNIEYSFYNCIHFCFFV